MAVTYFNQASSANTTATGGNSISVTPASSALFSAFVVQVTWVNTQTTADQVSGIAMTGTSGWERLYAYTVGSSGSWIVNEVWIGYANPGITPSGAVTATTTYATDYSMAIFVMQFVGVASASTVLQNAYVGTSGSCTFSNLDKGDLAIAAFVGYHSHPLSGNPTSLGGLFSTWGTVASYEMYAGMGMWVATAVETNLAITVTWGGGTYSPQSFIIVVLYAGPYPSYVTENAINNSSASSTLSGTLTAGTSSTVFVAVIAEFTAATASVTGISQSNVTWTFLGKQNGSSATLNMDLEVWIGFATGTPGTTWAATNAISTQMGAIIYQFTGIPKQPASAMWEMSNGGAATSVASPATIGPMTDNNTFDIEFAVILAQFSGCTFGSYPSGFTGVELATVGGLTTVDLFSSFKIASAPVASHNDSFGYSGTVSSMVLLGFVLSGQQSVFTGTFLDTFIVADTISLLLSRGLKDTFTVNENFVEHHGYVRPFADPFTVLESFVKTPIKNPKDPFTIVESYSQNRTVPPGNYTDTFTLADTIQKVTARALSDPFSLVETFAMAHVYNPATLTDSFTVSDMLGTLQTRLQAFAESFSMSDTSSLTHEQYQAWTEIFSLVETFATLQQHFVSASDLLTLSEAFTTLHSEFESFSDTFSISDVSSLTHQQQQDLADAITFTETFGTLHQESLPLSDLFTLAETFSTLHAEVQSFVDTITISDISSLTRNQQQNLTDLFALADTVAKLHSLFLTESDILTLVETFTKTTGGGGVTPVAATGAIIGASSAAAVVAALIFATALGSGRVTGLAGVAYQVTALLRGLCLLNALAGEHIVETGAATGGSAASGIEGAQIVVAGGSTEGDSDAESAARMWTVSTGEADGVSPEMDCDTQCIFIAEGNTMPDTPGSAVGAASYGLLHLIAILRGSCLAVGQVHSPVVGSGTCEGDGTAEYVSIALYDSETVGGESEAVGIAGCLFHVRGECDPIMASSASATANYGPGQIGARAGGRGVAAAVPTVLAV